jgi:anaerobic magnesium-protoporphyrin IX monomethyl ester cyclase
MKIALIQCPAWTVESPPYSLGILAAVLRASGHKTKCFDFNVATFNYCKSQKACTSDGITSESWGTDQRGNVWYEKDPIDAFIKTHPKFIESLIDAVCAFEPHVIGFSTQSTSKFFSLALAARLKERKTATPVIFGGPLVFKNCYGSDILKDCAFLDAISFSEADATLPSFLSAFERSGVLRVIPGFAVRSTSGEVSTGDEPDPVDDLDHIPFADYTDFPQEHYTKKLIPITTSRGCINRCSFCSESPHWRRYRVRSAENIVREMTLQLSRYPATDEFWFNDSLINGDMTMLGQLCDLILLRGLKIRWGGQGLIRKEMTVPFLKKMKKAGCYFISYGLESGSDAVLKLMRKGYTAALAERVIRDTRKVGIDVIFNIIVGFPGEDDQRFQETKDFVRRCRRHVSHIELPTYLLLKGSFVFNYLDDFAIAPIDYNEDWQLNWKTKDGTNTYQVRKDRLIELQNLLSDP